jgi:HK97 family phage prohead protease
MQNQYRLIAPILCTLADARGNTEQFAFGGYASVFGVKNSYGFVIDQGAYAKSLRADAHPVLLWQHLSDMPIGQIDAEEDRKGLRVMGRLVPGVEKAREAYALMKAGIPLGLSVGLQVIASKVVAGVDHVTEAALAEVSLVTFAADPQAKPDTILTAGRGGVLPAPSISDCLVLVTARLRLLQARIHLVRALDTIQRIEALERLYTAAER